jgi:hypothetical protein
LAYGRKKNSRSTTAVRFTRFDAAPPLSQGRSSRWRRRRGSGDPHASRAGCGQSDGRQLHSLALQSLSRDLEQGRRGLPKSVGADYVTLVTEGNSEKGIADIKAILAKTNGN